MAEATKIKIAFCTDGIFPHSIGGIQRHSALLLQELANYSNLEIHVLHPHGFKVFDTGLNLTEHFIYPINNSKNYLRECYAYSGRMAKKIDELAPDIIYAQGLTVWKNVKKYSNKLINNPHGLESFQAIGVKEKLVGLLFKRIQRKIFKYSRYIASEGGHLTKILNQNGFGNKIVFLPNAVELPEVSKNNYPDSKQPVKVFFMARFVKNKGIHILFEAVELLRQKGYERKFSFVLGGKGPLYQHYLNTNKYENVKLLGFLNDEDLMKNYINSDVFLLPTLFEGMPTVVLEAMSVGLPVIVSDVGGTPELIDESTGYLIKRNSAEEVYNALLNYFNLSESEKYQLGSSARSKVAKKFTWKKLATDHNKLFIQIYSSNSASKD